MKNTTILILSLIIITVACTINTPIETPNTYNAQKEDTSEATTTTTPEDVTILENANQKNNIESPWILYNFDIVVVGESSGAICGGNCYIVLGPVTNIPKSAQMYVFLV